MACALQLARQYRIHVIYAIYIIVFTYKDLVERKAPTFEV